MKILITGATGLVGDKLIKTLITRGHDDISILTRNSGKAQKHFNLPIDIHQWDPEKGVIDPSALEGVDIVFHLAGESVAEGRWSKEKKKKITASRIDSTRLLISEIKKSFSPPKKFICSNAIGIYGSRASETLDHTSSLADDFLANVCKNWENEALNHKIPEMKSYSLRTGIVLSEKGGALSKMLPPFNAGVGGTLGNGKQFMSWIHIDDLVEQFIFLAESEQPEGIYNGVAPVPVTNYEFTKTLGKVLKRPTLFPVPTPVIKLIFGEMSQILISDQKVIPQRFIDSEFKFKYPELEGALLDILKYRNNLESIIDVFQWVDKDIEEVFEFFSNERNLEKITPEFLKFKVLNKSTDELTSGTILNYKLKVRGINLKWQSEILTFKKNNSFVDTQNIGPYKKWHHTHTFYKVKSGTLIQDKIVYKVPLGIVGKVFLSPIVTVDLKKVFNYRFNQVKEIFN